MFGFDKYKSVLEYDKVVHTIAKRCVSESGNQRLSDASPILDKSLLNKILQKVHDMRGVYAFDGGFPIWSYDDIRVLLKKIEPAESYLDVKDLQKIENFLSLLAEIDEFHKKMQDKYPNLQEVTSKIETLKQLLNVLKFTIEPSGRIFDNASKELKAIRKDIAVIDKDIHKQLDRIKRNKSEHLQEDYITLRDGRLVLPVREFSVNKIPGIVHGQSGTGATYFVEPMAVVDLNNQMQRLLSAEHKEIINILKRISKSIREVGSQLIHNFNIMNELDVLQAKARYANEIDCAQPEISKEFYWDIKKARHPILLQKHADDIVPLDVEIGKEFRELIISGPNAGGKTVAIKTIGLLQLLFQSGFHIPVNIGTAMPICSQIFAVIGDEQSIEDDLSTFSSHIRGLNEVIEHLNEQSLVLIDEIGRGTDPEGGAALSISILERLNQDGVVSIVSTHQNQLKSFASETEGVENAAMQFDMKHLKPLFRLETGIPGSSYTFEICKRFGLDQNILNRAADITGKESYKLDNLLADVVEKSRRYQDMANNLSIRESELSGLLKLYNEKANELKKKQRKFEKESAKAGKQKLENINREIESVIREIKESQANKEVVKHGREKLNRRKKELETVVDDPIRQKDIDISQLKTGQKVHSRQYSIKGTISRIFNNRNEIEIEREGIKITIPVTDIEVFDEHGQPVKMEPTVYMNPGSNISNELDVRGQLVDEALHDVRAYLDSALLSEWEEVRIIHGKGEGTLRIAIHKYLAGLKTIKGYRLGKWGEGDTGVTVVTLK
jgi:DNA mismatch repair protein MutS2